MNQLNEKMYDNKNSKNEDILLKIFDVLSQI